MFAPIASRRFFRGTPGLLAAALLLQCCLARLSSAGTPLPELQRAFDAFQAQNGPGWEATWSDKGRLQVLRSRGVGYRTISGASAQSARQFLLENTTLFQLRPTMDDLQDSGVSSSPAGRRFLFKQSYQGLSVLEGAIEVHMTMQGRVYLVYTGYVPGLSGMSTTPRRGAAQAVAAATQRFQSEMATPVAASSIQAGQPELAISEGAKPPELVYVVILQTIQPRRSHRYVVSDSTGAILGGRSLIQDSVNGGGRVFDPNPVVTLHDQSLRDGDDSDAAVGHQAYFYGNLLGLNGPVNGKVTLDGPYVTSKDIEAPSLAPPSVDWPSPLCPLCLPDFSYWRSEPEFEWVMCYYHIDTSQRYIQSLGPFEIFKEPIRVDAHGVNGEDNSYYDATGAPGHGFLAFGDGGVDDAEDADVILHEYGHALQDNASEGKLMWAGVETRALSEGNSDYWAASNSPTGSDRPCIGDWDTKTDANPRACLRRTDGTKYYPRDKIHEAYADSGIWSAALWDIFGTLGKTITDTLVLQSLILIEPHAKPDELTFDDGAMALLDADLRMYDERYWLTVCQKMTQRGIIVPRCACDINGDTKIDTTDVSLVLKAVGSNATAPYDARDADLDGRITVADARICAVHAASRVH